ncbi:MAG: phosphoenolpyruvate synthase [Micropruina sp.]|nr:phosphoenolpyruvate synthase [Micropruina sp.]
MSAGWCVPLDGLRASDLELAGGKGANLGELIAAGFDVPSGFVVSTAAYRSAVGAGPHRLEAVRALAVPTQVAEAVAAAYRSLGGGPVAVRSSATAEDLPGAAFAGQQDTYLGVVGERQVIEAVRDCWASLWTPRAIAYRDRLGIDPASVAIAVVVQRMVAAEHAGVMFTADPVTGARDQVVIDANPGLGEAVVSGLVTPDHTVLDARDQVIEHRDGRREVVIRALPGGGTVTLRDAPAERLGEPDLVRLAAIGRRIAAHFGHPQDIEWAIAEGRIAIVQARPMTALPPAPIRLNTIQRFTGPVIVELVPRRPYPMELTAWTRTVGRHLEGLVGGLVGGHVSFDDVLIADDAVVSAFVPPNPHPTVRTPSRLLRTLSRMGRDPNGWRSDPRYRRYRTAVDGLAALNMSALTWRELLAVPGRANDLMEVMTALRVGYLPPAVAAMVRLRVLLGVLGLPQLFAALLLELPTETARANAELDGIAAELRESPELARRLSALDPDGALALLSGDPAAGAVRQRLDDFLAEFGHRETGSILLLREPDWAESPATVLALVQVLLADSKATGTPPFPAAVERLQAHPLVHATRSQGRVRRLVTKASAGVQVREDTHFELSRTMPPVRHAVVEAGRRLAEAGAIDTSTDVWYLTWSDLQAIADPLQNPPGPQLRAAVRRRRAAFDALAGSPLIATTTLYPGRSDAAALVTGVAGGGGTARGPVRVIAGPEQFGLLRPGDVLVCGATNPAWTPLFTRAVAVVVDHGGVASHAAIVAREYGIPAVMGTGVGTSVLIPGMQVVVDGDRGRVVPAGD